MTPGRLAVACSIVALTLLGYFVFPGHTYLQSDTQIYLPMLEHIWDPTTFPQDLVATKPHLSYTLYDEITIALRWLTRSSFQTALTAQQLLYRALQVLGIYLLASAFPLSRAMALFVAAICSLGATIAGPAVLIVEYEPVPRGFAIALLMLAIGLAAQGRLMVASTAAAAAFLYHAPTTLPFWIVFCVMVWKRREYKALAPLACAIVIVLIASRLQAGVEERQAFFFRIDPEFESLQRMRASYNWVSNWVGAFAGQWVFCWVAGLVAYWRVRPRAGQMFLLGLPIIGLLSIPVSYILLEQLKWGFIPQYQPARTLLFITMSTLILSAAAAVRAAEARKLLEAGVWFAIVFAIPMQALIQNLSGRQVMLAAGLAVLSAAAVYARAYRWTPIALTALVLGAYVLPPTFGRVRNYPAIVDSDVEGLIHFAQNRTPRNAMLLFADAGRALYPGIVRARSLRSVYVDWKSGGQVNYYRSLGEEWWTRWNAVNALRFQRDGFDRLAGLPIDYVVLTSAQRLPNRQPEYVNSRFAVYRVR